MKAEHKQLVANYIAGDTSLESELLQACREDKNVLKSLSEHIAINRLLELEATNTTKEVFSSEVIQRLRSKDEPSLSDAVIHQLKPKPSYARKWWVPLTAAACVMFCSVIYISQYHKNVTLATMTNSTNAVWENSDKTVGDPIKKEKLELQSGFASLKLNNGVSIVLEGPAELELKSLDLIYLKRGNLVVDVPKNAIGFRVLTPSSEIVDLGTEFGMSVNSNGASEVHVLEGKVKARQHRKGKFMHLNKNEAMAFNENEAFIDIPSRPESFMRALPGKSADNPDFLHWSCDQNIEDESILLCQGTGIEDKLYDGTFKSLNSSNKIRYVNGQFGEGIYFDGQSYVDTNFSGIEGNNPRTIAFWAKVPKDFKLVHGFGMLSWGRMSPFAAWQISPNSYESEGKLGRLRVGTFGSPIIGTTDLRDNRWHHIAVVMYGGDKATLSTHVLLYVDGNLETTDNKAIAKIDTQLDHASSKPLAMGINLAFNRKRNKKDINNLPPERKIFFKGWLDEIYIFDAALDAKQIQQLISYNTLKPKLIAESN